MSDSVLDSSSNIDLSGKFRSSACFSTLQDQMDRFYAMTSTPEYKNWQRPGLNANGSSSAPLQVKHLRSCLDLSFLSRALNEELIN
jgi:hypothetical protein